MLKMPTQSYQPIFELRRGRVAESLHFGALAVVDAAGNLIAHYGDPQTVTFTRSSAKPLQALALIEAGGHECFGLSQAEVAITCASHSGTDAHVEVVRSLQAKAGIAESQLMCGTHSPYHKETAERLLRQGEKPTPNRHNCSGKHSGMLALAALQGWPLEDYIDPAHPVQQTILANVAGMCGLPVEQVGVGTDGCSVPNFAVPLRNLAWAYARLGDPTGLSEQRAEACGVIVEAMTAHPEMVGGPGRFDTALMSAAGGRVLAKSGAEGYLALAIRSGVLGEASPGLGVALKIADGDPKGRARPAVALEVLRQLGALGEQELTALAEFGPRITVHNWREVEVGEGQPCFELVRD
jgi:L-asparaginase II